MISGGDPSAGGAQAFLERFLEEARARVDGALDRALPAASEPPARLHAAMRYAVFSGGKRLRPALSYAAAIACSADPARVTPVAAAVELIHAYTLVHDDLPALDDDLLRRGRPTVHARYGEALAILVGDALQARAFGCLAEGEVPLPVVTKLGEAAGSRALVGGQADDLAFDPTSAVETEVASIHARKTAALFAFATWGAGRTVGAGPAQLEGLEHFALHYGLAFQLVDDLLDADTTECSMLAVIEPESARKRLDSCLAAAHAALQPLGSRARILGMLADQLPGRLT